MASFKCCFGCEKRTVGCHATCLEYIEAKNENEENNLKRHEELSKYSDLSAYENSLKKRSSGKKKK